MILRFPLRRVVAAPLLGLSAFGAVAGGLESELGRNEVRVYSGAYAVPVGRTVREVALADRLERLGYERVRERPARPGQYFWGHEVFWIYRRAHRRGGKNRPADLLGLQLRRQDGRILGTKDATDESDLRLEPELLSESLGGDRALRRPVEFDALPEHFWRAVLAAEDARFFDHVGVDGRAVARALLANVKSGRAAQGGSTITQQLIKNRDLSPKKTLGRKMSEAVRALTLEAEYDKREILQAYLNSVYLGNMDGLAIHGVGAAAEVYFSKPVERLTLSEGALLAGMIQGPNRLTPVRHPERAAERRDWVLNRMAELGWARPQEVARAKAAPPRTDVSPPRPPPVTHFMDWLAELAREIAPDRLERGRGVVVETTLDAYLQQRAEQTVRDHLEALRRRHPRLRGEALSAALVALDVWSGAVLAYVGGDPAEGGDRFDRARKARRQPGSAVKPLLLLEAFESCGSRRPLQPATRVADEPLRLELPGGPWEPVNFDGRFHGVVDLRTATRHSYNVPFVRIARWCEEGEVVRRMRRAGMSVPDDPPPSFALGSMEATPLEMAEAFTVFASKGKALRALPVLRIERPGGGSIRRFTSSRRRVVSAASAYLVRDLLRDAVARGTGHEAAIAGVEVAGKTGTSSSLRDAWFAGHAEGVVAVAWVGVDRGGNLGLTGGAAAAPLWRAFMEQAVPASAAFEVDRPAAVLTRHVDPATGLLVGSGSRRGREELFRRGALPRRDRFWRHDPAEPVVR
jgi:penicillin-binding protein 1B